MKQPTWHGHVILCDKLLILFILCSAIALQIHGYYSEIKVGEVCYIIYIPLAKLKENKFVICSIFTDEN